MRLSEYGLFRVVDGQPSSQPERATCEEDAKTSSVFAPHERDL